MRRQLDIIPRLEKKLEEQQSLLEKTNEKFVFLSKAIKDVGDNSKSAQVRTPEWFLSLQSPQLVARALGTVFANLGFLRALQKAWRSNVTYLMKLSDVRASEVSGCFTDWPFAY